MSMTEDEMRDLEKAFRVSDEAAICVATARARGSKASLEHADIPPSGTVVSKYDTMLLEVSSNPGVWHEMVGVSQGVMAGIKRRMAGEGFLFTSRTIDGEKRCFANYPATNRQFSLSDYYGRATANSYFFRNSIARSNY